MKKIVALLFPAMLVACNSNPTPAELEAKLKSTMTDYLYKGVNYDSSKVKYHVKDVIYYNDDRGYYDCQFTVEMQEPGKKDTVGKMFAFISKKFDVVKRTY
jgi:hypothetical protein